MLDVAPLSARPSAVDACANALKAAILRGELAARFGVNRVTVRSALARLERERLLSVRQGSGHVVRDFRRTAGPDLIADLAALASTRDRHAVFDDLLLVRRHLAHAVLERLVEGAAAKDVERIGGAVDRLAELVERGASTVEVAEADIAVLVAVVEATKSPVLQLCLNPVVAIARELGELRDAIYADASVSVVAWRALLAWLESPSTRTLPRIAEALAARDDETMRRIAPKRKKR